MSRSLVIFASLGLGMMSSGLGCGEKSKDVRVSVVGQEGGYQLELRRGDSTSAEVKVSADVFRFDKRIRVEAGGKRITVDYNIALQPFAEGLEAGYIGTVSTEGGASEPFRLEARSTADVAGLRLDATSAGVLTVRPNATGFPYVVRIAQNFPFVPASDEPLAEEPFSSDGVSTTGATATTLTPKALRFLDMAPVPGEPETPSADAEGESSGLTLTPADGTDGPCVTVAATPEKVTVNGASVPIATSTAGANAETASFRAPKLSEVATREEGALLSGSGDDGGSPLVGESTSLVSGQSSLLNGECSQLLTAPVCSADQIRSTQGCLIARNAADGGGIAAYAYYTCKTSTVFDGEKLDYEVNHFNNGGPRSIIDLKATVPASVRSREKLLDPGMGGSTGEKLATTRLAKANTNQWSDNQKYTVKLVPKSDGTRSIQVVDHRINKTVSKENGFCSLSCEGPTTLVNGRCIWTGVTENDEFGDFLIETVASAGTGVLVRVAKSAAGGGLAQVAKNAGIILLKLKRVASEQVMARYSVPKILTAQNEQTALKNLDKAVRGTNPLSGMNKVGGGNCGSDALTQAVRLATGNWVCALAYKTNSNDGSVALQIADGISVLGGRKTSVASVKFGRVDTLEVVLQEQMKEGEIALLTSFAGEPGHSTLVAKVKGRLFHINNQGWEPKVSSLSDWAAQWSRMFGSEGKPLYNVDVIFGKKIGS